MYQKIKQEASKYLKDLIFQYDKYVKHKNVYELGFKYSSDYIEDFMYRCIDLKEDVMRKAEEKRRKKCMKFWETRTKVLIFA